MITLPETKIELTVNMDIDLLKNIDNKLDRILAILKQWSKENEKIYSKNQRRIS